MSLEDKITQDYVQAMKARDSFTSSVLSFLRAQINNVKVDKRLENSPCCYYLNQPIKQSS